MSSHSATSAPKAASPWEALGHQQHRSNSQQKQVPTEASSAGAARLSRTSVTAAHRPARGEQRGTPRLKRRAATSPENTAEQQALGAMWCEGEGLTKAVFSSQSSINLQPAPTAPPAPFSPRSCSSYLPAQFNPSSRVFIFHPALGTILPKHGHHPSSLTRLISMEGSNPRLRV